MPDVYQAVARGAQWLVADGDVVDVSGLIDRHPGGRAVLIAGLGRDISADFRHVPAHGRDGITRQLTALVIGQLEQRNDSRPRWATLADQILLVRNGFLVQDAHPRDVRLSLVYLGQSYAHLVSDHLADVEAQLHVLSGLASGPRTETAQPPVMEAISQALISRDEAPALALVNTIRVRTALLLNGLLLLIADDTSATAALRYIADWRTEEDDYWNSQPRRN